MAAERSCLVFGAGAVGGYLGGKLAASTSFAVTLLTREPFVQGVRRHGLVVEDGSSRVVTHPTVVSSVNDLGVFDVVLLTVRAFDVAAAVSDLTNVVGERGTLLAFQNGVGTEEVLAQSLGRDRVLVGTLTDRPAVEAHGIIRRLSQTGGVALATMDGASVPDWLLRAFDAAGLRTITVSDYRSLRWSKLLLNMLGSATTAILDSDMEDVVDDPRLFRLEQLAFREAGRVMDAQGIRAVKLPGYPVPAMRLAMRLPEPLARRIIGSRLAGARGGRPPGMRADMQRGKTEMAFYNGAVVREAGTLGITAPVNSVFDELVTELTAEPARRAAFRGKPDALLAAMRSQGVRV